MPHSPLYQKILAEAANDRTAGRAGRARTFAGTAPSRVSNVPVRHAPVIPAERLRELTLAEIGRHIVADWPDINANVHSAARPYVRALEDLHTVKLDGVYYHRDPAAQIVRYVLSNARSWRGENARLVKAELRRRLG